jgi:hypothetical protein
VPIILRGNMETSLSDEEYDYLEDRARLGLTPEEYLKIKCYLVLEAVLSDNKISIDNLSEDIRLIILITSAFGFYLDDNGELNFSL